MASHIDPMNGDCEEIRAPCPWSQIGCPESKVRVGNKRLNFHPFKEVFEISNSVNE